jgi:battenin
MALSSPRLCAHVRRLEKNAYPVLAFCYQFGVLISRSSISLIQIRRVWIITTLQALNFVAWLIHALRPFMPLGVQFVWMVFVGLMGGASYISTFYILLNENVVADTDREFAINITAIFVNGGIVLAAIFEIIASNSFLQ